MCSRRSWQGRRIGPLTGDWLWTKVASFGGVMKSFLATVGFLALTISASGQAAVEGALTHALSGGVGATAGKALGQVGNQMAGRLGQQTSNAVTPRVTTLRPGVQKGAKAAVAATQSPAASTGSLIASIQGGETPTAKTCAQQSQEKSSATQNVSDCKVEAAAANSDAHPSEITLPAPK